MKGLEIRRRYLDYFARHGHQIAPSAPLIPQDRSVLFNIAGMLPFKPFFLGERKPPHARLTSSQKCIRTVDIDSVGKTARHLTFFEMLGNFSFGDYFKAEAIEWAWVFLTQELGLDPKRLYATVYEDDDEALALWIKLSGLPSSKVIRFGKASNFWEAGPTGPCGPCSEILYDMDPGGDPAVTPQNDNGDRFLEIWNLVFMQFNQVAPGKLEPLPARNIDTGMGLERLAAVLQNKHSNFETDLMFPVIERAEQLSGKFYNDRAHRVSFNILADHARSVSFLLAEGLKPGNDGRGYVLRRLIRRAVLAARKLGVAAPAVHRFVPVVLDIFAGHYPELARGRETIERELQAEEERFAKTLDQGLARLEQDSAQLKSSGAPVLPGAQAFMLYDTYGFPLELTRDILEEQGLSVDIEGFESEMQAQKERARRAWNEAHAGSVAIFLSLPHKTRFTGYDSHRGSGRLLAIARGGQFVESAGEGDEVELVFDETPFYAERGGQTGDCGRIQGDSAEIEVFGCVPAGHVHVHRGRVTQGTIRNGERFELVVDPDARSATMKNHTGTHLLHAALRRILGEDVRQAGSLVEPGRLRFDFTWGSALGPAAEKVEIEVNRRILENHPVVVGETTMAEAQKRGALALFGEKYGDSVRVVDIRDGTGAPVSVELCGGTHCRSTGEIGLLKIISEQSLAAGVRRIEALTGMAAIEHLQALARQARDIELTLKVPLAEAAALVKKLQADKRELEKKLKAARAAGPAEDVTAAKEQSPSGAPYLVCEIDADDMELLRARAERARDSIQGPVCLAGRSDRGALLVVSVPKPLAGKVHAGKVVAEVALLLGGKGGGRPDFAQAGGRDLDKLPAALDLARKLIRQSLG